MHFLIFFVAISVGLLLTRWVRDAAIANGWLDATTSSRKVHARPVPRLGGVALVLGSFTAVALAALAFPEARAALMEGPLGAVVLGGGAVIALLGFVDDVRGLRARHKLLVQLAVAGAAWASGLRVEWLGAPFGLAADLGVLSMPLTVFWLVGAINAVNLIDGLDGLAGGVALIAAGVNLALAMASGDVLTSLLMVALVGALIGFLVYNFNPASIFMGDTGSMFLGFVLAATSVTTSARSPGAAAVFVPVVLLGLPVTDTLLAMGRRASVGRPLFSADKEHIHHRLMRRFGLSHRNTVLALYAVAGVLGISALALAYVPAAPAAWVLAALVAGGALFLRMLGSLDLQALGQASASRARNLELRRATRDVVRGLRRARNMEAVWGELRQLAPTLNTSSLALHLGGGTELGRNDLVFNVPANIVAVPRVATVPVRHGSESLGLLIACWQDGRSEINRDEEIGLEAIADVLAQTLVRIEVANNAGPQLWVEPGTAARATVRTVA